VTFGDEHPPALRADTHECLDRQRASGLALQAGYRLEDLERKVEERTRELQAANARLHSTNLELCAATERANAMTASALAANQAKSKFFTKMTHDFRTSMSGAMSMSDLLLKTPLDPLQLEYAEIIRDST
jgi:signal transduction histidine kinase